MRKYDNIRSVLFKITKLELISDRNGSREKYFHSNWFILE